MGSYKLGKYSFEIDGDAPTEAEIGEMRGAFERAGQAFPEQTGPSAGGLSAIEARVREKFGLTSPQQQAAPPQRPEPQGFAGRRQSTQEAPTAPFMESFMGGVKRLPGVLGADAKRSLMGMHEYMMNPELKYGEGYRSFASGFKPTMDSMFGTPDERAGATNESRINQWKGLIDGLIGAQ